MKSIYKILSGLILSVIATLAIAALVSVSKLISPETKHPAVEIKKESHKMHLTHKGGICHHLLKDKEADKMSIANDYPCR